MRNPIRFQYLFKFASPAALAFAAALLCAHSARAQTNFGSPDDIVVQGDFDGDGNLDYAVWRPASGTWFVVQSSNGQQITQDRGLWTMFRYPEMTTAMEEPISRCGGRRMALGTSFPAAIPPRLLTVQLGLQGDIPVPGNFGQYRKDRLRGVVSIKWTWYVLPSGGAAPFTEQFGPVR